MSTTRPSGTPTRAPAAPSRFDKHRFVRRLKQWSIGFTAAGLGLTWALVSGNVVGASNAPANTAAGEPAATPGATPHRAAIPTTDFFGSGGAQPQPILGNGGTGGMRPVVRGGTS